MEPETLNLEDDLEKPSAAEAATATVTAYNSNIDSARPFRSVKEAVAIFGERFLAAEIYAPKRFAFPQQETPICYYTPYSPSPQNSQETSWKSFTSPQKSSSFRDCNEQPVLMESLKKLEAELEETKMEVKLLKERESETEVALASLNAELHKNMSKLAQAEAAGAAAAKAALRSNSAVQERSSHHYHHDHQERTSSGFGEGDDQKSRDLIVKLDKSSTTLAQVLNAGEDSRVKEELMYVERMKKEKKLMKKKPIIPLVGDLFSRKRGNSTSMHNPLFASSNMI